MEMWWAGFRMSPWRLLVGLVATFVLLLGYNRYAGLRRDASFTEVAIDSVEELGIGLLTAAFFLWLTGRIAFDMSIAEVAGKITIEALTVAIGVSVGTAQLGSSGQEGADESEDQPGGMDGDADEVSFLGQLVLSFCGAILIAGNVAPTEEIILLASEVSPWRLLGLALTSLVFSAVILFYSDFRASQRTMPNRGILAMISGSIITYMVALAASACVLWFFGSFDGFGPGTWLAQTIVLGVAAALGASAGRLLLQANSGG
jgi:putative integral membrane protein (TIGR02587 family)